MMARMVELARRMRERDLAWMDARLSHTPFYAGYWVRRRLEGAIAGERERAHGVLLDVGCGLKPYEKVFGPFVKHYWGIEYAPGSGYRGNRADFCGDASALPVKTQSIDTVLCTEVLEHVPEPERVIAEIARVLRPGGTVICTAPFVYPIHDRYDFFRYSPDAVAAIMRRHGLEVESVRPLSGTGVTLAIMLNLYWFEIGFLWTPWLYPIGLLLRPLLLLLLAVVNAVGWAAEQVLPSTHLAFNHLTIARAPMKTSEGVEREEQFSSEAVTAG